MRRTMYFYRVLNATTMVLFSLNFMYPAGFIFARVMRVTCVPPTARSDPQYQTRLPKRSGPAPQFRVFVVPDTANEFVPGWPPSTGKNIRRTASPFSRNRLTHPWNWNYDSTGPMEVMRKKNVCCSLNPPERLTTRHMQMPFPSLTILYRRFLHTPSLRT